MTPISIIMIPNVYCPLCGVVLLPDPYSEDDPSWQSRVQPWYAQVRGLYSTNATVGYITTTGLGIVRGRNVLFAPFDSNQSYVDLGVDTLEGWRLSGLSENHFGLSVNVGASDFTTHVGNCFSSGLLMDQIMPSRVQRLFQNRCFINCSVLPVYKLPSSNLATTMRARRKHTNPSGCQKQWI